jgi:hypothetical protein
MDSHLQRVRIQTLKDLAELVTRCSRVQLHVISGIEVPVQWQCQYRAAGQSDKPYLAFCAAPGRITGLFLGFLVMFGVAIGVVPEAAQFLASNVVPMREIAATEGPCPPKRVALVGCH